MSETTAEPKDVRGSIADRLRAPLQDAIREGVKEALAEQAALSRERSGEQPTSADESGQPWGKYALLAVVGVGLSAFVLYRRWQSSSAEPEPFQAGHSTPSVERADEDEPAAAATTAGDDGMD